MRGEGRLRAAFLFSPVLLAGTVLAAEAFVFFFPVLFRGHLFLERDLWSYYLAGKSLVPRLFQEARGLPLWNPYFALGQPFAANPEHAIWHPLTALLLVMPFSWAFRLQVVLPVLGAGASMAFLQRTLRRSAPAAAFGALVWAFGGYVVSTINLLPILFAVAVLPAVVALSLRTARSAGARSAGLLALAFGLECLAGEPSTLLMTPLLVGAALLSDRNARRGGPAGWGRVLAGLAIGGLVGSAALLPGMHLAGKTVRAAGFAWEASIWWSMPPLRLLDLVFPFAFGHVEGRNLWYWGSTLYPATSSPFLYSLYAGLLAAVLAAVGVGALARARRAALAAWSAAALCGLLVALGCHAPVWRLLRAAHPLFRGLRYPEKFALLVAFPLVALACLGFDLVLRSERRRRRVFALCAGIVTLEAACGVTLLGAAALLGDSAWVRWGADARIVPFLPGKLLRDFLVVSSVGAGLIVALRTRRPSPRVRAAALLAITAVDLLLCNVRLVETGRRAETFPRVLAQLRARGPEGPVFHAASWLLGTDPGRWFLRPPLPVYWGIPMALEMDYDGTELLWSRNASLAIQRVLLARPSAGEPLLRRRGIAAVLQARPGVRLAGGNIALPPGESEALDVRWVPGSKGFAFFAASVHAFRTDDEWEGLVARLGNDAAHAALLAESDARALPPYPAPGEVTAIHRSPNEVALEVEARGPGPGLLAINQTWDELWRATVDGRTERLLRADLSLSALAVPPGRHTVRLVYRDPWVAAGAAVSAGALLGALALVVFGGRRLA